MLHPWANTYTNLRTTESFENMLCILKNSRTCSITTVYEFKQSKHKKPQPTNKSHTSLNIDYRGR